MRTGKKAFLEATNTAAILCKNNQHLNRCETVVKYRHLHWIWNASTALLNKADYYELGLIHFLHIRNGITKITFMQKTYQISLSLINPSEKVEQEWCELRLIPENKSSAFQASISPQEMKPNSPPTMPRNCRQPTGSDCYHLI